ncbi:type VI secretion system lipoprotein TssJ [Yersinia pekkanenii]|uniref:Lipoprotein n=1 Tax=Yersinia pekkanenii TaxID=1288385 RepID=A0A0T9QQZ4_9GAMM|nr:type VI secretion system lipoprotein TssJ [Yersinia pekkanenii]CNI24000.1 putative lipoprotein [Yersinia pekkanenii]CRY67329.1 putative lipoprotein [Yersinia pekkanenii]
MRSIFRLFSWLILVGSALLSGCSWFSSAPEIPPQQRRIELRIVTAPHINPGANGQAQPLKLCIVELNSEGWSPPGLYQGALCSGINTGAEVVSVTEYMLAPSEERRYFREVPFEQERWWAIAAEFQNMNNGKGLLTFKSDARGDFSRVIFVDGKNLSLEATTEQKVLKDK